ncbi:hypothetical protein NLJ89_g10868 [Agrocybe chaxingu]|uniref:Uncharacterized protein n=1 Tax=Agrocybe chaxingu TaxID=84603 RepID=A0A9W8MS67_9AGAR|nr:hypothetical protein NLJ89_g10868 [Agrocybe chaxingu]
MPSSLTALQRIEEVLSLQYRLGEVSDEDNGDTVAVDGSGETSFRKKVEETLREWIKVKTCRRDVVDLYFANPPNRQEPTGICCDNCHQSSLGSSAAGSPRPSTPVHMRDSASVHSTPMTPSKTLNTNGKRPMSVSKPPPPRKSDHLQDARQALQSFRVRLKKAHFTPSSLTALAILPDSIIKTLAPAAHIQTIDDLEAATNWIYAQRYGIELLDTLRRVDQHEAERRQAVKDAKAAARHQVTAARQEERKRQQAEERATRKAERLLEQQRQREEKVRKNAEEKARKDYEKTVQQAQRNAKAPAKTPRVKKAPIVGCATLQYGLATPTLSLTPHYPTRALTPSTHGVVDFNHATIAFSKFNHSSATRIP